MLAPAGAGHPNSAGAESPLPGRSPYRLAGMDHR